MTETRLGLLRHGQTDWNIDFRLQGISDIPLNATGIQQAENVARELAAEDWDLILASPLSRAIDTAKAVSESFGGFALRVEPLLIERSFGEAEGLSYEEYRNRFGRNGAPNGETLDELRLRVENLLHFVVEEFAGKRVLAVSHGALIRKAIRVVSNNTLPLEGQRFMNTSLSTLIHRPETGWQIENFEPGVYQRA
ncbi:MAG: histidine phosphatase family protein [Micrococcales bacterium]